MLLVISPSKTQKTDDPCLDEFTLPGFQSEIRSLVKKLKGFDRGGLASLMGISEKLAESTWNRFQDFSTEFNLENFVIKNRLVDVYDLKKFKAQAIDIMTVSQAKLSGFSARINDPALPLRQVAVCLFGVMISWG